jgi:hypothetical protein
MITVEDFSNQLSSSLFVSSPRNTVGAFMTESRSHPRRNAAFMRQRRILSCTPVAHRWLTLFDRNFLKLYFMIISMKATLWFLSFILSCGVSWAQGKLEFGADTVHLVYYDASCGPLAGQPVSSSNMPPGITLVADLYAGATNSSLSFVVSAPFDSTPGEWDPVHIMFPDLPANTVAWFQVQVRDAGYSNAVAAASAGSYAGFSEVFSAVPASSIAYPHLWATNYPVYSGWQVGTFNLDSYGLGWRGEIPVGLGVASFPPSNVIVTPASLVIPVSGTATFHAGAQGSPPLRFQWLFGTNALAGATNSALTLTNAQSTQSGQYQVVVTNSYGSATSAPVSLSVLALLDVHMVPALSLLGTVGYTYRIQWSAIGSPLTNWTDLATVTITNTGQLYFDLTASGQPDRSYRLVQSP